MFFIDSAVSSLLLHLYLIARLLLNGNKSSWVSNYFVKAASQSKTMTILTSIFSLPSFWKREVGVCAWLGLLYTQLESMGFTAFPRKRILLFRLLFQCQYLQAIQTRTRNSKMDKKSTRNVEIRPILKSANL